MSQQEIPTRARWLTYGTWACFVVGVLLSGQSDLVFGLAALVGGLLFVAALFAGLARGLPAHTRGQRIFGWVGLSLFLAISVGGGVAILLTR